MKHWWNDTDSRKLKFLKENLSHCHLSTTNPTWTGLGLNPGLLSDRLAMNLLNHDTAIAVVETLVPLCIHHHKTAIIISCFLPTL
jgi:hypothetical protein